MNKWREHGALFVITDPNLFTSHLCGLWNPYEAEYLSRSRRPAKHVEEIVSYAGPYSYIKLPKPWVHAISIHGCVISSTNAQTLLYIGYSVDK